MASCATCGDSTDLPYTCNYCGLRHCSTHRLPENHNCTGLSSANTHGPDLRPRDQWGSQYTRDGSEGGTAIRSIKTLLLVTIVVVAGAALWTGYLDEAIGSMDGLNTDIDLPAAGGAGSNGSVPTSADTETERQATEIPSTPTETSTPEGTITEPTTFQESIERQVHEQINEVRSRQGISSLDHDDRLSTIAWYHSRDMAVNGFFAHTGSDGDSRADRYDEAGYDCRVSAGGNSYLTGGENIFHISYSGLSYTPEELAEQIVSGWMDSPGHRENILEPAWENQGIGVYTTRINGEVDVYATQDFC